MPLQIRRAEINKALQTPALSVLSEQAAGLKETTEEVQAALDETERAQNIAMGAIQLAQNNTKGTLDLLITVSRGGGCLFYEHISFNFS